MHKIDETEESYTIPSKWPTIIEPTGSYIALPVLLTATNDAAAMARPVTAAPSCIFKII